MRQKSFVGSLGGRLRTASDEERDSEAGGGVSPGAGSARLRFRGQVGGLKRERASIYASRRRADRRWMSRQLLSEPSRTSCSRGEVTSSLLVLEGYRKFAIQPIESGRVNVTHVEDIHGAGVTHTLPQIGEARHDRSRCRASLPLLGSSRTPPEVKQDSPDPESVPLGQRFRSSCPETVTYRASVPASPPQKSLEKPCRLLHSPCVITPGGDDRRDGGHGVVAYPELPPRGAA